jgi:hypothetical protein
MNYDSLKITATTVVAKLLQEKYGTRIALAPELKNEWEKKIMDIWMDQ